MDSTQKETIPKLHPEEQLQTELEFKIDIPATEPPEEVTAKIDRFLQSLDEVVLVKSSDTTRHFQYFDTPDKKVRTQGWTLRCVSGFNPEKGDGKAKYRYDYKIGEVGTEQRKEGNKWLNDELSESELVAAYNLQSALPEGIGIAAEADTRHIKRTVRYKGSKIEMSYDMFDVKNGKKFSELEIELEAGTAQTLIELKEKLRSAFPVEKSPEIKIQKYERVLNSLEN